MTALTVAADAPVYDNRMAFAETLIELAERDPRIVAVCNDSVGSSNLTGFRDRFPDRLINVGIAEQNLVGVGAGLANAGLIPFVCAASPFLTGRALEQIKADVAYSGHNVILCGMSPGMAYGELGPTHHSVEDLSWLRALPGLDLVVPADRRQTADAVRQAAAAAATDLPAGGPVRGARRHSGRPTIRAAGPVPALAGRHRRDLDRDRHAGLPGPGRGGRCWPPTVSRRGC